MAIHVETERESGPMRIDFHQKAQDQDEVEESEEKSLAISEIE